MPIVDIKMLEGRTLEQKKELVEKVTQAIVEATSVTPERVLIVIEEMPKYNFALAGVVASECNKIMWQLDSCHFFGV